MRTYDLLTHASTNNAGGQVSLAGGALARLWELRGIPVLEEEGVYWTRYRGPIYATFPNNIGLAPEPGEIESILRKMRIAGARIPSISRGLSCGLHVAIPSDYGLEKLPRKCRLNVRRGLERCEVRLVDLEELLAEGIVLNRETLERQQRQDPEFTDPIRWSRFVRALHDSPGCSVLGAYVEGRLSAYLVMCRDGGWLRLLYKMSRTADMEHRTNYALDYRAIVDASLDPSIRAVENGFSSLKGDWGVDTYKKYMGYVALPTQLSIYLHPAIAPWAATRPMIAGIRLLGSVYPRNSVQMAARVLEAAVATKMSDARTDDQPAPPECQQEESNAFSRLRRGHTALLAWRLWTTVRKQGVGPALRKTAGFIWTRLGRKHRTETATRVSVPDEIIGLRPGEWVEVRPEAEILATLDRNKKLRGLLFTEEMRSSIGRRFRVLKRVEQIYLEESKQSRKLRNTVILEGAHCPGTDVGCDRYCYLFFREAWLRRVDPVQCPRPQFVEQAREERGEPVSVVAGQSAFTILHGTRNGRN